MAEEKQVTAGNSSWKNHPRGRVEVIESEEIRLEDFEALRRAHDKKAAAKRKQNEPETTPKQKKSREAKDASNVDSFLGPWSANPKPEAVGPSEAEMHQYLAWKDAQTTKVDEQPIIKAGEEKTIFHGQAERDYLGRTYISVPMDLDQRLDKEPGTFDCFAPKKLIHTWVGHTKGVTAIRFFPKSGHLLLSASQDMRIKLWDVHRDRHCLRTFLGHNKPVRDVNFDPKGLKFVSAGYDKALKYWDTETGQCLLAIEHSSIPFCAKFHPENENILLAGCADRRICQWDLRSGEIVQEYNQHLEAVNTITFFDEGRRFVSTGDDKTVRVWDFDVPVPIKDIAEPGMHSMPAAALHPSGEHMVFQSLNSQAITYSCGTERFQQRGRKFGGHTTSGYACGVGFSPDGKFLISGDGRGHLMVWDWKTGQTVRKIEAHSKVCIDVQWNPQESSRVATCSWDGTIKYWD
jgi:pre-mRNA-processing factor 17